MNGTDPLKPSKLVAHLDRIHVCNLEFGIAAIEVAQEQVAEDIASQAKNNSTMKDKLVKWGQSLGDATVSDVVKGVVKLAIRSAGIPIQ